MFANGAVKKAIRAPGERPRSCSGLAAEEGPKTRLEFLTGRRWAHLRPAVCINNFKTLTLWFLGSLRRLVISSDVRAALLRRTFPFHGLRGDFAKLDGRKFKAFGRLLLATNCVKHRSRYSMNFIQFRETPFFQFFLFKQKFLVSSTTKMEPCGGYN